MNQQRQRQVQLPPTTMVVIMHNKAKSARKITLASAVQDKKNSQAAQVEPSNSSSSRPSVNLTEESSEEMKQSIVIDGDSIIKYVKGWELSDAKNVLP